MTPASASRISVIIVCYYSGHLLGELLQNVRSRVPNIADIILVNNSEEDLGGFQQDDILVLNPGRNLGYGGGLNLGMTRATGDSFIFLNPDVEITRWSVVPESWPAGLFLFSGLDLRDPRPNRFPGFLSEFVKYALVFLWGQSAHLFGAIFKVRGGPGKSRFHADWVSGGFIVTNRKTMEVLHGFDEGFFLYYEELDLCKRAVSKGIPVFILPLIEYVHTFGTSTKGVGEARRQDEVIRSMWRYHWRYSSPKKLLLLFHALRLVWRTYAFLFRSVGFLTGSSRFTKAGQRFQGYLNTSTELLAAGNPLV
jgi:N-acetylglucosaminyl-diphospho-decaprenol L-rhamnosyltransferase